MSGQMSRFHRGENPKAWLERADRLLIEANGETEPADRFLTAYLSALRGAAAVIAQVVPAPASRRRRGTGGAWATMARLAPEFTMWADYFAEFSPLRAAIMSGVSRPMSAERADEFSARVTAFLHDVEDHLGESARLAGDHGWSIAPNAISRGLTA